MVKIRMQRFGAKKRPFYRIVAADSRFPRDGRFLDILGTYDAVSYTKQVELKVERIKYWLRQGAVPSDTVLSLLKKERVI